jgi:hypothetical protein
VVTAWGGLHRLQILMLDEAAPPIESSQIERRPARRIIELDAEVREVYLSLMPGSVSKCTSKPRWRGGRISRTRTPSAVRAPVYPMA